MLSLIVVVAEWAPYTHSFSYVQFFMHEIHSCLPHHVTIVPSNVMLRSYIPVIAERQGYIIC